MRRAEDLLGLSATTKTTAKTTERPVKIPKTQTFKVFAMKEE